MATSKNPRPDYASLFETITGESTITEAQQEEQSARSTDHTESAAISEYLNAATREDGLDDAVEAPESL
jgi:hypothetical protein